MERSPVTNLEQSESLRPSIMARLRSSFAMNVGAVITGLSVSQAVLAAPPTAAELKNALQDMDSDSFSKREKAFMDLRDRIANDAGANGDIAWREGLIPVSNLGDSPGQLRYENEILVQRVSPEQRRKLQRLIEFIERQKVAREWQPTLVEGAGKTTIKAGLLELMRQSKNGFHFSLYEACEPEYDLPPFINPVREMLLQETTMEGTQTLWEAYAELLRNEPHLAMESDEYGALTVSSSFHPVISRVAKGPVLGEITPRFTDQTLEISFHSELQLNITNAVPRRIRAFFADGTDVDCPPITLRKNGTAFDIVLPDDRMPETIQAEMKFEFSDTLQISIVDLKNQQLFESDCMQVRFNRFTPNPSGNSGAIDVDFFIKHDEERLARLVKCMTKDDEGILHSCYSNYVSGTGARYPASSCPSEVTLFIPNGLTATTQETFVFDIER